MSVLRSMTWSAMDEEARRALCSRGLEAIFDSDLKAAIGRIIDDVRTNGDEAVCRALRDFDRVSV
jgi:histidinol dehydrogenase